MNAASKILMALAFLGLTSSTPLLAQPKKGVGPWRPIKDELGLFSPQAEEQANKKVAELKEQLNKDLFIETIKAPAQYKEFEGKDKAARDKFFDQYAEKRFADLHENGVYVMILDNPHVLRVVVGNNTQAKGYFTLANRSRLVEIMIDKLKAKDPDGALVAGANFVYDSMKANHPVGNRKAEGAGLFNDEQAEHAAPRGFNWSPILTILAVVAGIWILIAVVRALFGGSGGGAGAPGMGYGGGGGGFLSSLVGGMFGAAAGMWMYNSFFGHGGSSAWGAGPSDAGGSTYGDAPDTSGSAGGDDYGAGDAGGGGDVGGGDWGGGGGDWGGGGGDFGGGGGGGDW